MSIGVLLIGTLIVWIATVKIPDFKVLEDINTKGSTKIYDRTGEILLYDLHQDKKRTVVPLSEISQYSKNATIAIEDAEFYSHHGIRITSIIRAVLSNTIPGGSTQGGSTITQQVIKMTLLSPEKTIARKTKEWVLAIKLDASMSKDDILALYLNEAPYGGTIYGIQEASRQYFGKAAKDLTLAEAAYLAAIPQLPTYYSPYGKNRADLDKRKNLVLDRMEALRFITKTENEIAQAEAVAFLPQSPSSIKAPHFVFFIKEYLESKYGKDTLETGGLKVTTTLDYTMQQKGEAVVKEYATLNKEKFNASNASLVAIDPKNGDILTMVGSKDYFDKEIDGNYNIALAKRQPGSAFKPFVYAAAFEKGYTPNTVLFDLPTEFQTTCDPLGRAYPGYNQNDCYMPENYDGLYRGPINLRNALAQSINVPAVKALYLVGIKDALRTAKDMGIKTLTDPSRYGLTLVLGGGEVSLLDITSAYGVFANGGVRNPYRSILKIENANGSVLEEAIIAEATVLPKNVALMISDILSDNTARTPLFGANSPLYFRERAVAAKTGTTNDYRDVWTVGYTPSLVVGTWAGNNDNSPMVKKTSGTIIAPLWRAFMEEVLPLLPEEEFEPPVIPNDLEKLKPVIRGVWLGGESFLVDTISGKRATSFTPKETLEEKVITDVRSILYWVNKNDPLGARPEEPEKDPQFRNWEFPIRQWWEQNRARYPIIRASDIPTTFDDIHTLETVPKIAITSPVVGTSYLPNERVTIAITSSGRYPLVKGDIFINGQFVGSVKNQPFVFSFTPSNFGITEGNNNIRVVAYDVVYNSAEVESSFFVDPSRN